jgi:hypothetical protein
LYGTRAHLVSMGEIVKRCPDQPRHLRFALNSGY